MIVSFLIVLIIAIVLIIGLLVQNVSISRKYNKYKQENDRLNELLSIPVPIIHETKYNVRTFYVKRVISEPMMLYDDSKIIKKQLAQDLAESLVSNEFVEFIEERQPGVGETITARIEVIQR